MMQLLVMNLLRKVAIQFFIKMTVTVLKLSFFCSLCSAWETDECPFTEHMTIVHDLPKLEENISVQCINAAAIQIQNY